MAIAGEIEDNHAGSLHGLGEALAGKGKERAEADGEQSQVALLLMADGLICQLWLGTPEVVARWDDKDLVPFMELQDGVFPPPVPTFPDSLRSYLERRANDARSDSTRARYHDFIWLRWRGFEHARAALAAYVAAGTDPALDDSSAAMSALDQLRRAGRLSHRLGLERPATTAALFGQIERSVPGPSLGFTCFLIESCSRLLATDPDRARRLVADLEAQAEASNDTDGHRARSLFEAAATILGDLGAPTERDAFLRRVAQSFELEAQRRDAEGGLVVLGLLVESFQIYTKLNDGDNIQRLKQPIAQAAQKASGETQEVSSTVTLDLKALNEHLDRFVSALDDGSGSLLQVGLMFDLWPKWEVLRTEFEKFRSEYPIQWLVTRFTVSPTGEVNLPAEDAAEREAQNLLDYYTQQIQLRSMLADVAMKRLRELGRWDAEAVGSAIGAVKLEWQRALASGLDAYEKGDNWTACHVIVPQLERMFRAIGATVSANVHALLRSNSIQFVTLGTLLVDPMINQVLGAGFCQSFAAAFYEPRGLNIRNRTSHGLLDPDADLKIPATLAVLAALSLTLFADLIQRHADNVKNP